MLNQFLASVVSSIRSKMTSCQLIIISFPCLNCFYSVGKSNQIIIFGVENNREFPGKLAIFVLKFSPICYLAKLTYNLCLC